MNQQELEKLNLEKLNKAYSSEPWWYDIRGFLILTFAYRSTLPAQLRLFAGNMGAHHLEAAIGTGSLFEIILRWRRWKKMPETKVVGFDYADRMLEGAKHRFKNEKDITLVRADIGDLPFEAESFDTANIANAIHCLPDVKKGFQEMNRVMKKGGTLAGNVLLDPKGSGPMDGIARKINTWGIKKGILIRPFEADEVPKLLAETGFEMLQQNIKGNCYEFVARKK